jgi:hypothetical protein
MPSRRRSTPERIRASVARQIRWGAVLMPLGFFEGGIFDSEGDPSFGVLLTPVGAVLLLVALARLASRRT